MTFAFFFVQSQAMMTLRATQACLLFVAVSLLVPSEQCRISLAFYSKASGQCAAYDSTIQTCNGQFTTNVSSVCLMDGPISNITDTVNSYIVGGSKGLDSACVKAATEFYCAWFIPQCDTTNNSSLPICLEQCTTFFTLCSLIPSRTSNTGIYYMCILYIQ